ncbi:MAG: M1 family metallopeptidase, partial [Acidimicrobiia bacterium]|nr:M1 family metallopeptidase [Acidimicrobiia bacterium]
MSTHPYRLPTTVHPLHYRLRFEPDIEAGTFSGSVDITAEADESTETIVLNSLDLTIGNVAVNQAGRTIAATATTDDESERLTLTLDQPVEPGELELAIDFSGPFNDQLVGPYLSQFTATDGERHQLVTTQFEATHARQCFPCWDEPEMKATFQIDLVIDENHHAVANSAETGRTSIDGGRLVVSFAPTVAMSTYLVAFVIGPIEMTDPVDVDGVELRVVHVPGKGNLTDFALEVGAFALRYFQEYFELPYPGTKLDLVAIPDFAFGAMENLGCVTFRETVLLVDPARATQPELQLVTDVIAHELAHMWFGDLVTMKWWNGLWLNEAFATFMEMRCTDAFRPEWNRWTNFGLSRSAAFGTDSLSTTRPIEYEVVSPTDAEGMFDVLTYEKGAAVVRMLEQYLGEDRFRAGIRRYMRKHQFDNADTPDLWDALEEETGEPVREIMDSWIYQGGYPQILASRRADGTMTLSQRRMTVAGSDDADADADEQTWSIPLRYRFVPPDGDPAAEAPPTRRVLLGDTPVTLPDSAGMAVVVNATGASFVRVTYEPDDLDTLAGLAIEHLSPVERYALVDDAWAAVLGDQASTASFLTLLEAMTGESDRSVWRRIINGFEQLRRLVDGEALERLEEIVHDALAPALAGLGLAPVDDDTDERRQLRADLVRALGIVANDPEIQDEAKRATAAGLRDPELVDSSLLAAAIDVTAATGDEADFDDFIVAWKGARTPQEELGFLGALTDFDHAELIRRLHTMILDGSIRTQNSPFLLRRALMNRGQGRLTWAFIAEHWST